jgi:putative hemolysin
MNVDPTLLGAGALLFASASFSGAEAALFTLAGQRASATQLPSAALALLPERQAVLTTILFGNLVVNLAFFAAVHVGSEAFDDGPRAAVNVVALAAILLFGELLPKILAHRRPFAAARLLLPGVRLLHLLVGPASRAVARRIGPPARADQPLGPEEAEALLRGEEVSGLAEDERALVRHVLELGKLRAGALRVPLARVARVPASEPLGLARRRLEREGAAHAAVVDARGEVIGALDLTRGPRGARVADAMLRVPVLPEVAPAANGLGLLRDSGAPFLLLVDEYGEGSGIVPRGRWADTLLDRLPRGGTVAAIRDLGGGRFLLDATLPLHDFEDRFGDPGERDVRVDTIGGLLVDRLGRVPVAGDHLRLASPGFTGDLWVATASETGAETLELWLRSADALDGADATADGGRER